MAGANDTNLVVTLLANTGGLQGGMAEATQAVVVGAGRIVAQIQSLENETKRSMAAIAKSIGQDAPRAASTLQASVVKLEATAVPVMANVSRQVREVGNDFVRTSERVTIGAQGIQGQIRVFGQLAAALGVAYVATRGIETITQNTVDWATQVERLSNVLGVNTAQASVWAAAARESGVPIQNVEGSLGKLVQRLNTNRESFRALGIDVEDASHHLLPFNEILGNTLKGLYEFERGVDRDAVAAQLFGRGLPGQTEELARLYSSLQRAQAVATAFGVAIDEHGVAAARHFEAAQADMGLAVLGFEETLAKALMPTLDATLDHVLALARDGTLKAWAEGAAVGLRDVVDAAGQVGTFLSEESGLLLTAGEAWIAYKGALVGVSAVQAVVTAYQSLATAIRAVALAQGVSAFVGGVSAAAQFALETEAVGALTTGISEAALMQAALSTSMQSSAEVTAFLASNMTLAAGSASGLTVELAAVADGTGTAAASTLLWGAGLDGLLAALGPVGLAGALVASLAALISYEGKWGEVSAILKQVGNESAAQAHAGLMELQGDLDKFKASDAAWIFREISGALQEMDGSIKGLLPDTSALQDWFDWFTSHGVPGAIRRAQEAMEAAKHPAAEGGYTSAATGEAVTPGPAPEPTSSEANDYQLQMIEGHKKAAEAGAASFRELTDQENLALAKAGSNWAEKLRIAADYTAKIKQLLGEGTDWDIKQQTKEAEIRKQAASAGVKEHAKAESEITALARENANTRLKILTDQQEGEKAAIKGAVAAKIITVEEGQKRMLALLDDEIAARKQILELEAATIAGSPEKAESLRTQLQQPAAPGQTTEEHQAQILVEFPPAQAEKFVQVQGKLDELDAYFNKHVLQIKSEFNPSKNEILRDAQELKTELDEVGNHLSDAFNGFFDAMMTGSRSAAGSIAEMRSQLTNSVHDTELAARTAGVHSNAWVDAKNREIEAQNRLNQTISEQANIQSFTQHLFTQWGQEALHAINDVIIDTVKYAVLRVALEKSTQAQILTTGHESITEQMAMKASAWLLEKIGVKQAADVVVQTTEKKVATTIGAEVVGDQAAVASKEAATAEEGAIDDAGTLQALGNAAAKAFGKIVAAFSDLGPWGFAAGIAVAGGIAALILGMMGKFEEGGDVPEGGMMGLLHPDEMVLNPATAERVRAYAATPEGKADLAAGARIPKTKLGQREPLAGGEMVLPKGVADDVRAPTVEAEVPQFSAAGGMTKMPAKGGMVALHPEEMVLDSPTAAKIRAYAATPEGKADLAGGMRIPRTKAEQQEMLVGGEMVVPKPIAEEVRGKLAAPPIAEQRGGTAPVQPGTDRKAREDKAIKGVSAAAAEAMRGGFFSAAGGMTEVPSSGALAVLHPQEMVLDKGTADAVRGKGGGDAGSGDGKHDGGKKDEGDKKEKESGHGGKKDEAGIQKAGTGVTAPAFAVVASGSGSGGAGGSKIQDVRVVAAPITVSTHAKGGEVGISGAIQTTPADGITPVQQQGIQTVQVVGKVPVTFSAIQESFYIGSFAGITWPVAAVVQFGANFGMMNAFEKGGYVPSTGPALVHEGEFVLPAAAVQKLASKAGSATTVPDMFSTLEGVGTGNLDMMGDSGRGQRGIFSADLGLGSAPDAPIESARTADRAALASMLVESGSSEVFQQENHFHNIDNSGAAEFIEKHGHMIADQTWKRTTRMNRGMRRR